MIEKPKSVKAMLAAKPVRPARPASVKTNINAYQETYVANCKRYNEAAQAYYVESKPIMDDSEFDKLAHDIKAMLALHPELAQFGNPLATVQPDHVEGFKKAQHSYPMLSLEDIYTEEELTKFLNGVNAQTATTEFSIECKLDGLSLSLIYEHGTLVRAVTRGDGSQGDDVTAQAYCVAGVWAVVPYFKDMAKVEVRGEVVMPWAAFNKYNDACTNPKDKFANPRNAASGTLKSYDPNKCRERGLLFVAYYIDYCGNAPKRNSFQYNRLHQLESYGFNTPRQYNGARYFDMTQPKNVMELINELHNQEYPFPIDGIVIKAGYMDEWEQLGYTDRFYKWGIAFKFKQESLQSRLLQVNWQLADSGRITPVAIYEPIQMFGTTCQRATLNNPDWIAKNLPGLRIGDTLLLTKGGEIIPKITGCIHREPTTMDIVCPRQWKQDVCDSHIISQIGGIVEKDGVVSVPGVMNGKSTYRDGAYLMVEVERKAPVVPPAPVPTTSVVGSSLKGKTILVSGNFGTPQIRKDIERTVVEQGGKLANGVTLSVDYYVLPDNLEEWKRKAGSKWEKIQQYCHTGRIITKDKFYSIVNN